MGSKTVVVLRMTLLWRRLRGKVNRVVSKGRKIYEKRKLKINVGTSKIRLRGEL